MEWNSTEERQGMKQKTSGVEYTGNIVMIYIEYGMQGVKRSNKKIKNSKQGY